MKNNKKIRIVIATVLIFASAICFAYGGWIIWGRIVARDKLDKLQEFRLETDIEDQAVENNEIDKGIDEELSDTSTFETNPLSDKEDTEGKEDTEDTKVKEDTDDTDSSATNSSDNNTAHTEESPSEEKGGVAIKKESFLKKDSGVLIPIDFESLQRKNPDIYAWITVPGTKVDYPIVQREGTDQEFYLDHGYEQEPNYYGAIFTENLNGKTFTDPMTVIYGHNMKDGSMFQTLHSFEDPSFFKKYRKFVIYTPKHKYTYLIFAAYSYEAEHLLKARDYWNKDNFQEYLDKIYTQYKGSGNFVERPKATVNNRIVTLSTCIGQDHSQRYLVQGLLTKTE